MIKDQNIVKAVSTILQRSERQTDDDKLVETFVDSGIIAQLENQNNQVFYGRRGTGKTHVLKVLKTNFEKLDKTLNIYIDCRTLGSSAQFSDHNKSLSSRCLSLFRDIFIYIHGELLEYIVYNPSCEAEAALEAADAMVESVTKPHKTYLERARTEQAADAAKHVGEAELVISKKFSFNQSDSVTTEKRNEISSDYDVTTEDKIIFPDLTASFSAVLKRGGFRVIIMIDEWSSLPLDIQPYLAELIKRSILPIQAATLKIAALEHRTKFSLGSGADIIGFELGADISTAQDLDEYYVFDRNPNDITVLYAAVIYRHINQSLPSGYLNNQYQISDGISMISKLFTARKTFQEVARASEGVVRDLINIFTLAFFNAQRRGRSSIDQRAVIDAARQWFEQDKQMHLDEAMNKVLRQIVDDVIGHKSARSFLLPRDLQKHPMIQKLFDARVLHLMLRGYADKDNPGVRYNIYTVDYGTYVDLLGTAKQPELGFDEDTGPEYVVPFNDKRSIRRIILTSVVLES